MSLIKKIFIILSACAFSSIINASNYKIEIADFAAFSADYKYAFFRIINPNSPDTPVKYTVFDMKHEKIIKKFRTDEDLLKWNLYFAKIIKLYGIKKQSYKGYSVTMQSKNITSIGKKTGMHIKDSNPNSYKNRDILYKTTSIFSLIYDKNKFYKKVNLFETSLCSYSSYPKPSYSVWWDKNTKALAIVVLWKIKSFGFTNYKYKVYALSW